jgi:hypothetical protein
MFRINIVLLSVFVLSGGCPYVVADNGLQATESRWFKMLVEEIPQVSEPQKKTAIAMTVVVLAETGRHAEARLIAGK